MGRLVIGSSPVGGYSLGRILPVCYTVIVAFPSFRGVDHGGWLCRYDELSLPLHIGSECLSLPSFQGDGCQFVCLKRRAHEQLRSSLINQPGESSRGMVFVTYTRRVLGMACYAWDAFSFFSTCVVEELVGSLTHWLLITKSHARYIAKVRGGQIKFGTRTVHFLQSAHATPSPVCKSHSHTVHISPGSRSCWQ